MDGKVYLVGAGCGEADLITFRGQRLLCDCDAVVYDDLIASDLLVLPPSGAELIYMGKRSGRHSASQKEISDTLIRLAEEGKRVVRLKGGDPFVFGRGGEELQALQAAGIPFEVIPGISSAIAIPEEAGIPVTHRGLSRSLHVVAGHTADTVDGLPENLEELANLHGTLVFLMGLRQLPEISERLILAGLSEDTPSAVISGGNTSRKVIVRAPLCQIASKSRDITPPAVIVIGDVAALDLMPSGIEPLNAVTIALTGSDSISGQLEDSLKSLGANVFRAQRSQVIRCPLDFSQISDSFGWLVFTSANGVDAFFDALRESEKDIRDFAHYRFAVIGSGTKKRLGKYGVQADLCPKEFTVEDLGKALLKTAAPGTPIFLLRSRKANGVLRKILSPHYPVREIPIYDLKNDERIQKFAAGRMADANYILFSSASGVDFYFEQFGTLPSHTIPVCIGHVCASRLRMYYAGNILTAAEATASSMIEAIMNDLRK